MLTYQEVTAWFLQQTPETVSEVIAALAEKWNVPVPVENAVPKNYVAPTPVLEPALKPYQSCIVLNPEGYSISDIDFIRILRSELSISVWDATELVRHVRSTGILLTKQILINVGCFAELSTVYNNLTRHTSLPLTFTNRRI